MNTICPWCQAPRAPGPTCPQCGANYAKAEAIKQHGRAELADVVAARPVDDVSEAPAGLDDTNLKPGSEVGNLQLEFKLCVGALPTMLCIALAFNISGLGHFLQRTFLTMPVHELGHALTAWLCGFWAVPTLWFTHVGEERGLITPLLLLAATGYGLYRAWLAQTRSLLCLGGIVLLLQAIGTLGISEEKAQALIAFGGDGMGMIIATALMASFFFGKHTQLYKGALRWGFVVIGAAAFVDIYAVWWPTRNDLSAIPFGVFESGMPSDSLTLVEDFGWSEAHLAHRYVALGMACLVVLVTVYAWGVRQAWRAWQALARQQSAR